MALIRLLCSPSTQFFLTSPSSFQKPPQRSDFPTAALSLSFSSISPLLHSLTIKTRRVGLSSTQPPGPSSFSYSLASSAVTVENPVLASETEDASGTRLCAQNIPWTFTAEDIRALFEKHGTVVDVELSMHNKTRNRGLAFITMGSAEEARAALTNLESYDVEGRALKLNYAWPRRKKPSVPPKPGRRFDLFVANLSYEAGDKELREFFDSGANGSVASAEVIFHDNPRRPAGYGFVSFISKAEAEAALTAFQGKMFMGRPIRVARSRRFSKQESKLNTLSEDALSELNPPVRQSAKANDI